MLNFWKSVSGLLEVEVTSAEFDRIFRSAGEYGIVLYHMETVDSLTVRFQIRQQDYKRFAKICQKRGSRIKILRKMGLYWNGRRLLMRPAFFLGMIFLLCFFIAVPTRVLFVQVEGNERIPSGYVLEAAEACGIRFGALRKEVRSEQVKNALQQRIPGLQWVGVNTRGCVAVISVRERHSEKEQKHSKETISSMVAARDGVVDQCTALRGSLMCKPGQAVIKGQILISGYTDCGSLIRAEAAEGEVFARTERNISVLTPATEAIRESCCSRKRSFSLIVGKKRIKIPGNSGNWDTTCGRIYKEYYITLPGGYRLPFALAVDEYSLCNMRTQKRDSEKTAKNLKAFTESLLQQKMIAGKILKEDSEVTEENGLFRLNGQYLCHEMIGRIRQEQIGE